ncbi:hypothetical protein BH11PAT1_BH11PAT1_6760 [soil metagenome]
MPELSSPETFKRELQPLDPTAVKLWIKTKEMPFLNALSEYGDMLNQGRKGVGYKFNDIQFEKFVGAGLCTQASRIMRYGIKKQFGENADIWQVASNVDCKNIDKADTRIKRIPGQPTTTEIGHAWLRFTGTDGQEWFIDPTYGQINHRLNRIVMSPISKESSYYNSQEPPTKMFENLPGNNVHEKDWIQLYTDSYTPYQKAVFFKLLDSLTK